MLDLLNEISEMVYVVDLENHDLLYMNTAGRKSFDAKEFEGKKCYHVIRHRETPCEECPNKELRQKDFVSWNFTDPATSLHYAIKSKQTEWEGRPACLALAVNVTESEKEKNALKNGMEGQEVLLECAKLLHILGDTDLEQAIDRALEKIGGYLEADRVYIFEIHNGIMSNTHEWCAPGIESQIAALQNMPVPQDEQLNSLFHDTDDITMSTLDHLKEKYPDECAELFNEQGIQRMMAIPLEQGKKLLGYLGVDNPSAQKLENISKLVHVLAYLLSAGLCRREDQIMRETLSYFDPLTGALNRSAFSRDLELFISLPESVGVARIDINNMKQINDEKGQAFGDRVLIAMTETLKSLFGSGNIYRSSGDEFIVICRSISREKLDSKVQELGSLIEKNVECHASIGHQWARECSAIQRIIFEADEMMAANKKKYHQDTGIHHPVVTDDILGLAQPENLQKVIREGRFLVYFQPKVSIQNGKLIGAEALVRLRTPENVIVAPDRFIPLLERSRMISRIDFHVFDRVCAYLSRWQAEGLPLSPVSVNFSRYTLTESGFQRRLQETVEQYGIPKNLIEIEVTETIKEDDSYNFTRVIEETRKSGFSVSIDDFGVKNANLSLFTALEFDALKIDKSLISKVPDHQKACAVIRSICVMCHQIGIHLVAEGVETKAQEAVLQELGFDGAQGYLYSRPLPRKEFEEKYLRK